MIKVEYKKINYIFSINNCVEDNIRKLSLTDETIQFIKKINEVYNLKIKEKITGYKLPIEDKKKLLKQFLDIIPSELMILRNHIKNCLYVNTVSDLNFKIKTIEEDFKRLSYIK